MQPEQPQPGVTRQWTTCTLSCDGPSEWGWELWPYGPILSTTPHHLTFEDCLRSREGQLISARKYQGGRVHLCNTCEMIWEGSHCHISAQHPIPVYQDLLSVKQRSFIRAACCHSLCLKVDGQVFPGRSGCCSDENPWNGSSSAMA